MNNSMTGKHSADRIIDSIAHFTGHSEREALEHSLARTLHELLEVKRVALFKVMYEYKQPIFHLAIELDDDGIHIHELGQNHKKISQQDRANLIECLTSGRAVLAQNNNGDCTYLHPITDHLGNVSGIFCLCGRHTDYQNNQKIIDGYFKIYGNYLRLLDESEHDTLTGLLNRRTFDQDLQKILSEWQQSWLLPENSSGLPQRRGEKISKGNWLAEIDIDFFKQINDQYGHLHGDKMLREMSSLMQATFRISDKLFRFGGEEFVVILRNTDRAGAAIALNRFMANLKKHKFPLVGQISVSIGIVEIANETIPSKVLGHADDALYFAKQHGRDQVCWYDKLVEDGIIVLPKNKAGKAPKPAEPG